jgi:hypothetical protein
MISKYSFLKLVVLFSFLILSPKSSFSQDVIYTKTRMILKCQILKEYPDKFKISCENDSTKKARIIPKFDIILVQYADSSVNIISASNFTELKWALKNNRKEDSVNYSIFYIVYNSGYITDRPFPVYFNGKLIKKLDNQSRIQCKIFSEGNLHIYRNYNGRIGPSEDLVIKHSQIYGIRITVDQLNVQTWDPNKQYSLKIISDTIEISKFLKSEYYGFSPYKSLDYKMAENPNDLIIKK